MEGYSDSPLTVFAFEDAQRLISPGVLVCFTINVIMGSGFLGVPAGFASAGLLLGPVTLIAVTLMQWWAAVLLAECVARANALLVRADTQRWLTPTLQPFAHADHSSAAAKSGNAPPALAIPSHTSFEILMLCRLFLGKSAERVVTACCVLYMVGVLWSFISVFASSLTAVVPLPLLTADSPCDIYLTDVYGGGCIRLYYSWVGVFGVLMGGLLLLEVDEQVGFQITMTIVRALVIVLMVLTLILGQPEDFASGGEGNVLSPKAATGTEADGDGLGLPLVHWKGLAHMIPIATFCQLFQIGVPALLQPLANKRAFPKVFALALGATLTMYMLLGAIAVRFFGRNVDASCNLNWRTHANPTISFVVSLFPAVDCLSVFPINALFLSNNLMSIAFGDKWRSGGVRRRVRVGSRLLCILPPFACALAFPSLAKALDFTGLVGIALAYIVTPALHLTSLHTCRARWGGQAFDAAEAEAGFATRLSRPNLVIGMGASGTLLLFFCVGNGLVNGF